MILYQLKSFLVSLILLALFSSQLYASNCTNGERVAQGSEVQIGGDCVAPPQDNLENFDCGTGMKLVQGTVNSCIEGAEVETFQPHPEKFVCGVGMRLIQGTADSCAGRVSGNISHGNGSTLKILSFDGTELDSTRVNENGEYNLEIDMSLISNGFIVEMSGGILYSQDFNSKLIAIYGPDDNISQANATPITTLVAKMAMENSDSASIESRDEALQKLEDMGMLKQEDWFEAEPSLVNMDELHAVVQGDGLDVWLNGMIDDLGDSQLGRNKMSVFGMAHGGVYKNILSPSSNFTLFAGEEKEISIRSETNDNNNDTSVTLTLENAPEWITVQANIIQINPPEDMENSTYENISVYISKNNIKIGRKEFFSVTVLKSILLLNGNLDENGGKIENQWKDISISVDANQLLQSYSIKYFAGYKDGQIKFIFKSIPILTPTERMKLNIKLPTDKVLIQNYLQNNSNETSNRSSRSVENNDNLCTNGTDAIWPTDPKTFKFKEIILKALYTLEVDTQFLRFKVS